MAPSSPTRRRKWAQRMASQCRCALWEIWGAEQVDFFRRWCDSATTSRATWRRRAIAISSWMDDDFDYDSMMDGRYALWYIRYFDDFSQRIWHISRATYAVKTPQPIFSAAKLHILTHAALKSSRWIPSSRMPAIESHAAKTLIFSPWYIGKTWDRHVYAVTSIYDALRANAKSLYKSHTGPYLLGKINKIQKWNFISAYRASTYTAKALPLYHKHLSRPWKHRLALLMLLFITFPEYSSDITWIFTLIAWRLW